MIMEFHFVTERPDIYINGIGLFHHWWLHIKLAYAKLMLKLCEQINEYYDGKKM